VFGSFVARQDQGLACSARLVIVNNLASEPRLVNSRVPSAVHEPGSAREPCLRTVAIKAVSGCVIWLTEQCSTEVN